MMNEWFAWFEGQDAYAARFKGLQDYGESGITRLEELVDAALRASDQAHAAGNRFPYGAALFTANDPMKL